MRFLDLFSGIGGFTLPLIEQGHECVGFSEIDKYAIEIYNKHFNHKNYGDITNINVRELPDFDLLVGGFPCQAFSIAGKRKGFEDTRGTLFFEIARILEAKKPSMFLLENVKGLLSHDKGNTFGKIISTLSDLGYSVEWQVLNSKNFGVPQNRERVFIIGHLGGVSRGQVFPLGEDGERANEQEGELQRKVQAENDTANCLTSRYYKMACTDTYIKQLNNPVHSNDRVYSKEGISPTLNTAQGGNRQPFVKAETRIRRLTPTECERLQGFPDGWTEGLSDTQRYKCLGNAVTTNVVREIIKQLIKK